MSEQEVGKGSGRESEGVLQFFAVKGICNQFQQKDDSNVHYNVRGFIWQFCYKLQIG